MKTIPLVRASLLLRFTHWLDQIGAPTERLLERHNLSIALLRDPEGLIPLLPSSAFLEAATDLEGVDGLGLLVGQQTQVTHLGEFGRWLNSSLTPFDCLTTLERTINLLNSGERVKLLWQPDGIWLQSHLFAFDRTEAPQAKCFSLMIYLNLLQAMFGPDWRPLAIQFAISPSPAIVNHVRFAGVPLQSIKLSEIALELGYTDHGNFSRAFKRWTGVTPRAYRVIRQEEGELSG